MITLHPVVLAHQKRADGSWNVKIRITFKGRHRYLPTSLSVTANQMSKDLKKIKDSIVASRVNNLLVQIRNALAEIPTLALMDRDVDYVMEQLHYNLNDQEEFRLDFFDWADDYILCKRPSTMASYFNALNAFERFLGKRHIDINDITKAQILAFRKWIDNEPHMRFDHVKQKIVPSKVKKSVTTGSRYIRQLAHIYEAAKDTYNDEDVGRMLIPRSPFAKIPKPTAPPQGQRNLGVEVIQMMIDDKPVRKATRRALDVFLLSFGTMGANMVDLYNAPAFQGNLWKYERQKVASRRADRAKVECLIDPRLWPIIERLQDGRNAYWLPVLRRSGSDHAMATMNENALLKTWAKSKGLEPFTFYAARHTFASLARSVCGIEKATVDEMLAHRGDYTLTDIYAERDWRRINTAAKKVLNLFTWPEK